jgi:hypothetical protein
MIKTYSRNTSLAWNEEETNKSQWGPLVFEVLKTTLKVKNNENDIGFFVTIRIQTIKNPKITLGYVNF